MADPVSWRGDSRRSGHQVASRGSLLAVVAVLAVSVWLWGAASWFRAEPEEPRPGSGSGAPARAASRFGRESLLSVAPADLPAVVRDRYRLRPDRRLLAAVAEVHRLRTGAVAEPVSAEFQGGRWRISAGGEEVGALSEFPSFEEATDLLARWSARLRLAPPAADPSGADLDTRGLERALRDVDASALASALSSLGGSSADVQRDETKVRAVTLGLAWLSTLTVDSLDQADPLLAEAWAWLALARASREWRGGDDGEVLIARALGYEAAAARASSTLAADDPVRLYATRDETRLGSLCAGRSKDRACHFLRLALLAELGQSERLRSAILVSPFQGEASVAFRGLETRLPEFEAGVSPGSGLAALVLGAVSSGGSGPDDVSVEARTRDFESAVEGLATRRDAGPVAVAAVQSAYRAAFYSGLHQEATFLLHNLASGSAAQKLAASLTNPAAGTAEELRSWIEVSGRVKEGSTDMRPVAGLLESARAIGAVPLFDLGDTLARHTATTDPLRRQPIPALFERLDTRPAHRVMAARTAERNLVSPWLFETLARAAAEAAPHLSGELPAVAAKLRDDTVRLREVAGDSAMSRYTQVVALDALAKLGKTDDAFVRARYEAIAADPDEGPDWLVEFLETRGDLRGALAAVETAIRRGTYSGGALGLAGLQTEKARLQLRLGDPDRAFATLQPALAVFKEETLLQGATIELVRNRPEKALALAQAALERYPDRSSETSGLIVRARWRLNEYSLAAKEVAASRNGIGGDWNRFLPEAFAEIFATAPEESARQAFSELAAAGIAPHVLADVAIALGKKRGLGIALPLLAGLRDPKPEWQDSIRLATYDLIREKSGDDAALSWIRNAIPDRSHNFAMTLYQMRRYDLLVGLFAIGEEGGNPRLVRMLKIAALLHLRETQGPRWDELVAELSDDPGGDFFACAGRYLAGRTDVGTVLRSMSDPGDLASIGWVNGVKAASEGRFADADGWFQVALESGLQQQPPHAWSWVIESEWLQSRRSLEILAKKGEF